jgi:rod shape-determining protein MreC
VVASSINNHFRVTRLRLDNGDAQIEEGMPVVSADGLVGRILHVYGRQSDVLLVSDAQSSIDVVIPETGGRGLVRGLGRDDSYACQVEWVEQGPAIEVGQKVVTSGLGKHFPPGLVVGTVSRVGESTNGLYQNVELEPAASLSTLDEVLVLLEPPAPPDPSADKQRKSSLARETRPF